MMKLAVRAQIADRVLSLVKWIVVALPSAWATVRVAETFSGETTSVDVRLTVTIVLAFTLTIGGAGLAYRIWQQKKDLIEQRKRISDLEQQLVGQRGIQ
jgi:hypothetical protein